MRRPPFYRWHGRDALTKLRKIEDYLERYLTDEEGEEPAPGGGGAPAPSVDELNGDVTGTIDDNTVEFIRDVATPTPEAGEHGKGWFYNESAEGYELWRRFGSRCVLVAPDEGDYDTLSAALAAITPAGASDPWLIVVSGAIAETATITAKSHVNVLFLPGARLTINTASAGHGIDFSNVANTCWASLDHQGTTITRSGATGGSQHVIRITGATCDATVQLVGLSAVNTTTGGGTAHGIVVLTGAAPTLIDCTGQGGPGGASCVGISITSNAGTARLERCKGTGGSGGASCHGINANNTLATLIDCEGYGGSGGASCFGINATGATTSGTLGSATLLRCAGTGGSGGNACYGINLGESTDHAVRCLACVGFGGSGGTDCSGFRVQTSSPLLDQCFGYGGDGGSDCDGIHIESAAAPSLTGGTYCGGSGGADCRGIHVRASSAPRCRDTTFRGGGVGRTWMTSYAYAAATAKWRPHATAPYTLLSAFVKVNADTAGATVQLADAAAAGNNLTATQSLAVIGNFAVPITGNVLIAGAAYVHTVIAGGSPADASFTIEAAWQTCYTGCYALYLDTTAQARFNDCVYDSNLESDAIYVTASGDDASEFLGGSASSGVRSVGTRPYAFNCAAAWNPAPVYLMCLSGGSNNLTADSPVMNGTNPEIP